MSDVTKLPSLTAKFTAITIAVWTSVRPKIANSEKHKGKHGKLLKNCENDLTYKCSKYN